MAKSSGGANVIAGLIGLGVLLHRLHEAVDGYEWLAEMCVWCRLREHGA